MPSFRCIDFDPDGNPRTIPVRHNGLVVMHSKEERDRYWKGVDREAAEILSADFWRPTGECPETCG